MLDAVPEDHDGGAAILEKDADKIGIGRGRRCLKGEKKKKRRARSDHHAPFVICP